MLASIQELFLLLTKSKKIWVIPVVLSLIIIALLVVAAQTSPVPIFLYPLI